MGEAGKVNINTVADATLRKMIGQLGLEGEARDVVVDSILDWRDPDDFYRINGAENDYYQSLKEPYNSKNGNLDSIEELLLVRGVTPDPLLRQEGTKKEEGEGGEGRGRENRPQGPLLHLLFRRTDRHQQRGPARLEGGPGSSDGGGPVHREGKGGERIFQPAGSDLRGFPKWGPSSERQES